MKTSYIIHEINTGFTSVYRGASSFVNSGAFWDFCIDTIRDPRTMSLIAFANDLGIPPVRALLRIWECKTPPAADFEFDGHTRQSMGALMGFVFKNVLGYQSQKERCQVKQYGVQTATRFLDGPYVEFEP